MQKHAVTLVRDFVDATRESTYNIDTHKFSTRYYLDSFLFGPRADIDAIKAEIIKFAEGFTFEKRWAEKVIDE